MRFAIFITLSLFLVSCASGPGRKKGPSPYSASWEGKTSNEKGDPKKCPANKDYMKMQWKSLVVLAGNCVQAKNFFQLERVADQLAKIEPESHWGSYYLSLAAEYRKDLPRAFWMINLALKKAPEDGIALFQRARLYWNSDQKDLALVDLKEAVERNPSIVEAHVLLGQIYFTLDETGKAKSHFQSVLARDARNSDALLGMGELYFKGRSYEEAYSYHRKALSHNSRLALSFLRLAQIQEIYQKDLPASLASYKDLMKKVRLRKVDGDLPINLEDKIKNLSMIVDQNVAKSKEKTNVSRREPTGKKVSK